MDKLTRDGVCLSFEDVGRGAPPILLIHDLGSDHTSLGSQLEYFRHHHRVVAVDLPGHGRSDPAPRHFMPVDFAGDIAWLCYELGVYRPVAVGHGLGGAIAIELAAKFPDLLAAVVAQDTPLTRENAVDWNGAGPLARCTVPALIVETGRPRPDVDRLRELSPHTLIEFFRVAHQGNPARQINAAIDAFLVNILKGRAAHIHNLHDSSRMFLEDTST